MTRRILTLKNRNNLETLLLDKELAGLGDAYVNFVYSLAQSQRYQRPMGVKVKNHVLADAVQRAGLRKFLPHRIDRHTRGNAAEALLVYAWLEGLLNFDECIKILRNNSDTVEAFTNLLRAVLTKLGVVLEHR